VPGASITTWEQASVAVASITSVATELESVAAEVGSVGVLFREALHGGQGNYHYRQYR
jgi:hypothetical protein